MGRRKKKERDGTEERKMRRKGGRRGEKGRVEGDEKGR